MTLPRILLVNDHPAGGGIGRYTLELRHALRALAPPPFRVDLLLQNVPGRVDPDEWHSPEDTRDGSTLTVQPRPWWAKRRGFGTVYLLNSHCYFPRRVPKGYDLYHFSSQMMGAGVGHAAPAVVTVHDLIAVRLRANHPGLSTRLRRRHFRPLRRARELIFISESSRQDFLSAYDYPESQTCVIHHGVRPTFAPQDREASRRALGLEPGRPVLLHVGSEERRKNVETLLDAIALLVRRHPDLLLLRVGGSSARSRKRIARHHLERHVRYLPSLPEDRLVGAYAAADLFVFPSYFEGFGLPVLEAMSVGCPVIAARATSIPEVTGDAAVLVEPMDAVALADAIDGLLGDPARRASLTRAGIARAAPFTWDRAARQTAAAYRRALDAR
ncbi:MAG: glycosyltransferase family 1 protein [Gemmatimonadales bacterium]